MKFLHRDKLAKYWLIGLKSDFILTFTCIFVIDALQVGQALPVDAKAIFLSLCQLVLAPVLLGATINSVAPTVVSGGSVL